jgi:ABC-type phosphate transport system permease subunit
MADRVFLLTLWLIASLVTLTFAWLLTGILIKGVPSIVIGLFGLAVGRATAETAALIFTSDYVDRMPESLNDSGRALAVHIYDLSMHVTGGDQAAYRSALVLVTLVIVINLLANLLSLYWAKRKVTLASPIDLVHNRASNHIYPGKDRSSPTLL